MASRHIDITVEVSLDDFDDEAILEAARGIIGDRAMLDDASLDAASDIGFAIRNGDLSSASLALTALARSNAALADAIDLGMRRIH